MKNSFAIIIAIIFEMQLILPSKDRSVTSQSIPKKEIATVVYNPSVARNEEKVLTIKQEIELKETSKFIFTRPTQIVIDKQKNIYVLDVGEKNIKKFDQNGQFIKSIGKPGMGPTELDGLNSIFIANDKLVAWCRDKGDLVYFDLNGRYYRTSRLMLNIGHVKADSKGNIYGIITSAAGGSTKLVRLDEKIRVEKVYEERAWELPRFYGASLTYCLNKDDLIVIGNPKNYGLYELKVIDAAGNLRMIIKKNHKPMIIPNIEIEYIRKNNPFNWEIPKYYMPYNCIYATDTGMIIVNTYDRLVGKREKHIDIFNEKGQFVDDATIGYFYECLWDNNRLYTIEENDEGLPIVRVYKLSWKI